MDQTSELTPRQREFLAAILGPSDEVGKTWDPTFVLAITSFLNDGLRRLSAELPAGDDEYLDKYKLDSVLTCERRFVEGAEPFAWSVRMVRGIVVHRAIERLIVSGWTTAPLDVVEQSIADLTRADDERGPGEFLVSISATDRHDLILDAADVISKFMIDFPPIERARHPRAESRIALRFGRFHLRARPDLLVGRPRGDEARVVIVDFKTGEQYPQHQSQAYFYALVEALRSRTPPLRVVSYYLDSGRAPCFAINEASLESAARRVLAAAERVVGLRNQRAPTVSANPQCRNCPLLQDCDEGRRSLRLEP